MSEFRIRAMFEQQIRAFLVIENATQPVALSRSREPRGHAGLADCVHIHPQIDQLPEQRVPSAVRRTEQSVFTESGHAFRVDACIQQKLDRREGLRLRNWTISYEMIEARCCHNGGRIRCRGQFWIGSGCQQNPHHFEIVGRAGK